MLRRAGVTTAALVALAFACAPAHASITRAESILPPGESGFVSIPGLADGSGSPHLYDQQQPFIEFKRKNDLFGLPADTSEDPKPGVHIERDNYGVPSIEAGNDQDAWWGAGYATAEDRLFELEIFRRATTGHLAEILGKSYVPMDAQVRRDFYTPSELTALFNSLPAAFQARYTAYADGVDAWVDHVNRTPT